MTPENKGLFKGRSEVHERERAFCTHLTLVNTCEKDLGQVLIRIHYT